MYFQYVSKYSKYEISASPMLISLYLDKTIVVYTKKEMSFDVKH